MPVAEEPLPVGIWLSGLRKLAESCVDDNGDSEDRAVRRAFHFLKLSPPAVSRLWAVDLTEDDLEAMLEQGRVREAACEIVGAHAAVELSHVGNRPRDVATLRFDDEGPVRAEGATPALALISAWAQLLAAPR